MRWEYGFIRQVYQLPRKAFGYQWSGGDVVAEDLLPLLNLLGQEGWEVIQIARYGGEVAVLKRLLPDA